MKILVSWLTFSTLGAVFSVIVSPGALNEFGIGFAFGLMGVIVGFFWTVFNE